MANPIREGGYKDFYDPFVEDVIDTSKVDIREALEVERNRLGQEAGGLGAFGRRRDVLEGTATGKSAAEEAKLGAQLRSAAYTGAQQQAQSAFENQQKRGQTAGQLFQGLGTGIGALGEATQAAGFRDVNTLFNTGALGTKPVAGRVRCTAGRSVRGSIRTVCSVLVHAGHSFKVFLQVARPCLQRQHRRPAS